eukprot:CAMPEP_0113448922 /NCGR_PEP_ID=MMETSP0014_2-20120614/5023_1 /TAXON_ID=2857 /ORGANISM="Nitzschia sp." /LENGTH=355 /DNA_ID=CAMNT_0000340163 /DNA_START=125 /DNA_END=1189 /DNA_ORIENTATION=- /assembly_acc=CAM_ASM_000159
MQIRSPQLSNSSALYNNRRSPPGSFGTNSSGKVRVGVIALLLGIVVGVTIVLVRDTDISNILLMSTGGGGSGGGGGGPSSGSSANNPLKPRPSGKVRFVKMEAWKGSDTKSMHGKNKNLHSSSTKTLTFMRYRVILEKDDQQKKNDDTVGKIEPNYMTYKEWLDYVSSIGETETSSSSNVGGAAAAAAAGNMIGSETIEGLSRVLRVEVPYKGYRFETPPITSSSVDKTPFEFVIVEDNYLAKFAAHADYEPFLDHLQRCNEDRSQPGCAFQNLKGDATLIAPRDMGRKVHHTHTFYGHLASFMNNAPEEQMIGMWKLVAKTIKKKLSKQDQLQQQQGGSKEPVWFSTAGTGVAW